MKIMEKYAVVFGRYTVNLAFIFLFAHILASACVFLAV